MGREEIRGGVQQMRKGSGNEKRGRIKSAQRAKEHKEGKEGGTLWKRRVKEKQIHVIVLAKYVRRRRGSNKRKNKEGRKAVREGREGCRSDIMKVGKRG